MTDLESIARQAFAHEPDKHEVANTPTTFRRVMVPLACAVVAALALAIALPGAWEVIGKGGF